MHLTPRRPWAPLSDAEWAALAPHLRATTPHDIPLGRPLADPRARMDAIFHAAVSGEPWRALPPDYGNPFTVARHFRRLAHAGFWSRLLFALRHKAAPPALRGMEYWLCRAARRAMRLLRMQGLVLARRLGLASALPMWPWHMPDWDLSQTTFAVVDRVLARLPEVWPRHGTLTCLGRCLKLAGGRPVWSARLAPP